MSDHRTTLRESHRAALTHARTLWTKVQAREAFIALCVRGEIDRGNLQHEEIIRERDSRKRAGLITALVTQRVANDKKIRDLTGEYDRAVATATMYGIALLTELMGNDIGSV